MRIKTLIAGIVMCVAVATVSGCKREQAASEVQAPRSNLGLASEAAVVVDAAKSAAKGVTDQAAAQVKAAEQQAQGLIDRATAYVADQKYQEGLSSLSQLTNIKLTAEQQKSVDDLKAQIQSALAKATGSNAASALGGALGSALGGKK